MAIYGYIKRNYPVPTAEQLTAIVDHECDELFIENDEFKASTELDKMLKNIMFNDQIVIYDIRVLFKGFKELKELFKMMGEKKIRLISINDKLDTQDNAMFLDNILLMIKTEEEYRSHYIKHRIDQGRAEGKRHGRPRVDEEIIKKIQFLFNNKKYSLREISRICNVSLGTVHKYTKVGAVDFTQPEKTEEKNKV